MVLTDDYTSLRNINEVEHRHDGMETMAHTNNYTNVWNKNKMEQRHDGT